MTYFAKDEHCLYCNGYHPRYLDGCHNLKQSQIVVIKETTRVIITHDIICFCPHCDLGYSMNIGNDEDIFHVHCPKCHKYFLAKRELEVKP